MGRDYYKYPITRQTIQQYKTEFEVNRLVMTKFITNFRFTISTQLIEEHIKLSLVLCIRVSLITNFKKWAKAT